MKADQLKTVVCIASRLWLGLKISVAKESKHPILRVPTQKYTHSIKTLSQCGWLFFNWLERTREYKLIY